MKQILIASPDESARRAIAGCLAPEFAAETASSREACLELIQDKRYEFLFVDVCYLYESIAESERKESHLRLGPFWHPFPGLQIVVLGPPEQTREAVDAVKAGASNYLTYPVVPEEVHHVVENVEESLRTRWELDHLRDSFWRRESLDMLRTRSPIMREILGKLKAVAPTRATVLLTGETGTGKGVMAKLIHQHSNRASGPFIAVHCGAIPENLVESELFGHEKGAFTGAVRRKLGKFEIAREGSIFLDEIGTISPSTQVKLLQVLQDGIIQRVGGDTPIRSDVRIIAATNADLKQMCEDGWFRWDLYYRLNVFPLHLPPLRERIEDIPLLCDFFVRELNRFHGKNVSGVHPAAQEGFARYPWPGNIRELENLVERAYILETSAVLRPSNFPPEVLAATDAATDASPGHGGMTLEEARRRSVEQAERIYLIQLLTENRGRIDLSAAAAGISTRQLHKLMTRHGLKKEKFKRTPDHDSGSESEIPVGD